MGIRTGNPTWVDFPSTATLITAAKLNAIEAAIDASPASSSLGTASTRNVPAGGNAAAAEVVLGNDSRLSDQRTPLGHTHPASDVVSGLLLPARLGSGTADSTTFLRGDNTWQTVSGGSGSTGSVQLVVARTDSTTIGQDAWSTFPLDGTPSTNIGGGTWNSGTSIFTIPSNGLYLCLGAIRLADSATSRDVAIGIGTTNGDGAHVLWGRLGGFNRQGRQYTRLVRFNANDQVRLYIYSDGSSFVSGGGGWGQFLSITKLAD